MRWRTGRRSRNIEDRRKMSTGGKVAVGTGAGTIVLTLLALFLGVDPGTFLGNSSSPVNSGTSYNQTQPGAGGSENDELAQFASVILADTEDVWNKLFSRMGKRYQEPKLVLFSGQVQSACGFAQAASGPFYCPGDNKVYLDLTFFREMKHRFRASGDFAWAYVISHEVGHHVQNLLGILPQVSRARQQTGKREGNRLLVRLELQADCFAGVWANNAHRARNILESGDVEEGLNAANAIGDDLIQKRSRGYVVPDSFTHGSSEQRVRWFRRGLETGDPGKCDTFQARQL